MSEKILSYVARNHIANKEFWNLKSVLSHAEEMEILASLNELSSDEQVIMFRLLAKDVAISLFEELDTDLQQNLLRYFSDGRAVEFVNEMAPDDRVKLLDELPAGVAKSLLDSISPEEREATNILLGYKPKTAGRIMTTKYVSLKKCMTVAQALENVREKAKDMETIYMLYVTDSAMLLEGVLTLKALVCAQSNSTIADIMSKKTISVTTDTDQEEVARTLQELDLLALPVVDKEGRMIGIVTIDDAVDILEEEATEDIYNEAGLANITGHESDRSEVLIKGSIWKIWRVRLPFLIVTLVAGFVAGFIIEGFEAVLESIAVVAVFIPLIMDMGGNVGTQSSTVFARGVVLGHISMKEFFKPFIKEVSVGFSMGMLIGTVSGAITYLWQGIALLGVAVGISLVFTMTLAASLGFLVPFILIKFNLDQAAGSAPIITSIKDITGLLAYFVCVSVFLGYMM
jgi:magnesium transporter